MADIERARRRNNLILGVIMIFLLVASTAGYSLMSGDREEESVVEEMGFEFVRDGGMWKLAFGSTDGHDSGEPDEVFVFRYLPSEVGEIDVNVSVEFGDYAGEVLYFVNAGEGAGEVLTNLDRYILRYQESCLEPVAPLVIDSEQLTVEDEGNVSEDDFACKGNFPVKDCGSNLVIFEAGNETRVYGDENCVFVEGDYIRGVDAFLYKILGVN